MYHLVKDGSTVSLFINVSEAEFSLNAGEVGRDYAVANETSRSHEGCRCVFFQVQRTAVGLLSTEG